MNTIAQILRVIESKNHKAVSFDLFDTLVRRSLARPDHLFGLMEPVLGERGYDRRWIGDFAAARVAAGARAIHHAGLYGRDDFCLDIIYDLIATILPASASALPEVKAIELNLEASFLEPYPEGVMLFDAAKRSGKRVFIVSDQYLPTSFLGKLLTTFGICGYEALLLSGEIGKSKAQGSLYTVLLDRANLKAADFLHVGDNPHVDVEVARSRGIAAMQIRQSMHAGGGERYDTAAARLPCLGSIATARYFHDRADDEASASRPDVDPVDFLGYTFYGPLLTYIAKWLVGTLRNGEVERILLLARDGEGLSKVLPVLFPEFGGRIHYTHASRRLLVYPSRNITAIEVERHYRDTMNSDMPVHDFLDVLSGRTADFSPLKASFPDGTLLSDPGIKSRVLEELGKYLEDRPLTDDALRHRDRIRTYYREKVGSSERIGLFDIGWRCNLQRSLQEILGDGVDLTGFYLGSIYEAQVPKALVRSESFAFNNDYPSDVFEDIAPNIWPLELIFSGTERSVVDIVPEEGTWRPHLEPATPAQDHVRAFAQRVQDAALRFVTDACRWNRDLVVSLAEQRHGVAMMREFLARPTASDARALARFSWAANIDHEEGYVLVKAPRGRSRKALFQAREGSNWLPGFDALLSVEERRGVNRYKYRVGLDKIIPLDETLDKVRRGIRRMRARKVDVATAKT